MKRTIAVTALFLLTIFSIGIVTSHPKKTLVVGDSYASYFPLYMPGETNPNAPQVARISRYGAHWTEIESLIREAPKQQYDRVLLLFGMAERFNGTDRREIEAHQRMLARMIAKKYGIEPVVIRLDDMQIILKDPRNQRDVGHLNSRGYGILARQYHLTNPRLP